MNRYLILILILAHLIKTSNAQTSSETIKAESQTASADDPSKFFTRIELFNELQHHDEDFYINQTILRTNIKIGKRLTTRIDIPYVYNTKESPEGYKKAGLGDISFRLLGYRIYESPKSALTLSVEFSLNTAESPLLGTGKNLVIPMITYSKILKAKKTILAFTFQQVNSFSGDEDRNQLNYSKIQAILLLTHTKKIWTAISTDWFADYENGGLSLNLKGRVVYAQSPIIHFWAQAGAGIFGDFIGRFQWSAEIGSRFFLFRKPRAK